MKYESTRGGVKGKTFEDVLFSGYAADGGIFLPEVIPKLKYEELLRLSSLNYPDLCREIVQKFLSKDEYEKLNIDVLIRKAFSTFRSKDVVHLANIGKFHVAELWHGKSFAFKDLGVSCLSAITIDYLKKKDLHVNVICATSGDTGGSIMEHLRGSPYVDVFTLLPEGRCSEIQERQMICIDDQNIHAFSAQGTSDDFDVIMSEIFDDKEFAREHNVMSFSSQNWTRVMIQMVHYFFSYFRAVKEVGDLVSIVVPSGGLGNLTAGYVSYLMGLPIELVAAVNQNDATHQILTTGNFKEPQEVLRSSSCSMDIMVPLNIERIIYLATNRDDTAARLMKEFYEKRSTKIPETVTSKIRQAVQSATVSEKEVKETIKHVWDDYGYHIEPHTAVAVSIAVNPERYGVKFSGNEVVCLSCASPQKFPEIFKELGVPFEPDDEVKTLLKRERRFKRLLKGEDWTGALKSDIRLATKRFRESQKSS